MKVNGPGRQNLERKKSLAVGETCMAVYMGTNRVLHRKMQFGPEKKKVYKISLRHNEHGQLVHNNISLVANDVVTEHLGKNEVE